MKAALERAARDYVAHVVELLKKGEYEIIGVDKRNCMIICDYETYRLWTVPCALFIKHFPRPVNDGDEVESALVNVIFRYVSITDDEKEAIRDRLADKLEQYNEEAQP